MIVFDTANENVPRETMFRAFADGTVVTVKCGSWRKTGRITTIERALSGSPHLFCVRLDNGEKAYIGTV